MLEATPADASVARAYARLAQLLMMSGQYAIARVWAEKALTLAEEFGAEAMIVHVLNTLGVCEYRPRR